MGKSLILASAPHWISFSTTSRCPCAAHQLFSTRATSSPPYRQPDAEACVLPTPAGSRLPLPESAALLLSVSLGMPPYAAQRTRQSPPGSRWLQPAVGVSGNKHREMNVGTTRIQCGVKEGSRGECRGGRGRERGWRKGATGGGRGEQRGGVKGRGRRKESVEETLSIPGGASSQLQHPRTRQRLLASRRAGPPGSSRG